MGLNLFNALQCLDIAYKKSLESEYNTCFKLTKCVVRPTKTNYLC